MLDFLSVDVAYFEELSSDVKNALLDWVKEGGTIVFEGSGGWTALQKMNINGFGSSKTFSAGSNQKLLYRSLGDGSVWFLGKTLSQTVSRLTDERKSQFILILSKGASGSYSEDFSSLSVYENSSLLYRLRTHKSSAETPKVWIYVAILIFISGSWHSWNLSFDAQEKKNTLVSPACLSACCMLFHFDIHSRNKHTLFTAIYSKPHCII